jgi:hypothetical protein
LSVDYELVDDGVAGANIDAPSEVYIWRDGDVLRLHWQAPSAAKYLLLRFNGVDLGYVDASLGEFEIRDVDFVQEYNLTLAWMDATGEMGEFAQKESVNITDEAPIIESNEDVVVEVAEIIEPPVVVERAPVVSSVITSGGLNSGLDLPAIVPKVQAKATDNSGVVAVPVTKQAGVGLKFSDKSNIVGIVMGMLGAGGLLTLFIIRRRRGY